jgi:hypothetical protein
MTRWFIAPARSEDGHGRPAGTMEAIPSPAQQGDDRAPVTEVNLLMVAVALAVIGRDPYPVLLVGESADRWAVNIVDAVLAVHRSVEVHVVSDAKRDAADHSLHWHSRHLRWEHPIALLVMDGPRHHPNIFQLFAEFEPWIVANGYVAFCEYDNPTYPDITDFVNELIGSRHYRGVRVNGTMAVIQRRTDNQTDDPPYPGQCEEHTGTSQESAPRVLEATIRTLRETLERTAWIEYRGQLIDADRLGVIAQLRETITERTAWAERMVAEAEARGAVIEELHQALIERTAWAERMVAEAEARGAVIEELQRALAELNKTQKEG